MEKLVLTLVLMLTSVISGSVAFGSHEDLSDWQNIFYIELGTSWEVDVKSNVNPDEAVKKVVQRLDGTETINDRKYLKLWIKIDDAEEYLASYIHLDKSKMSVYALDPENIERGERLIYSFVRHHDAFTLTSMSWDGKLSEEDYTCSMYGDDNIQSCGYTWYGYAISVFPADSDLTRENLIGKATWYDGFGGACGFTNQLSCLDEDYTTILRRVITSCNGVIYENLSEPGAIDAVYEEEYKNNVKYHLDGTLFREGDKGIYIVNGKKMIAR